MTIKEKQAVVQGFATLDRIVDELTIPVATAVKLLAAYNGVKQTLNAIPITEQAEVAPLELVKESK